MRESYILYQSLFQPVLTPGQQPEAVLESKFHFLWSEPVRFRRIHVSKVPYGFQDTDFIPKPNALFGSWFPPLSEPVRQRIWLKAPYDPDFFYPPRVLPNPDVTAIMAAAEDADDASFGVDVFTPSPTPPSQAGASVTIVEVPMQQDGAISIREP